MPSLSLIIPIYNNQRYLARCFENAVSLQGIDYEVIFVDDGSSDGSGAVLDQLCLDHPFATVIHKLNGGVCSARNLGLNSAKAPYALLMDQDDLLSPLVGKILLSEQQKHPNCYIIGLHTEQLDELCQNAADYSTLAYPSSRASHLYNNAPFPPPWGKLLNIELIRKYNVLFREDIRDGYEDRPFMRDYFSALWKNSPDAECIVVQLPLYYWERGNENSVSSSGNQPLKPWHLSMFDGFMTDCLEQYHVSPLSLQFYMLEYVQTLAFSIRCLPKAQQQEELTHISRSAEYKRMLSYFKSNRFYSPFYWAFLIKNARLLARLSVGLEHYDAFYWRFYKIGKLLCPGWTEWSDLEHIPE